MIARLEPLPPPGGLAAPFDYALGAEPLHVGSIVRVPFGRQALDGVVTGLAETSRLATERLLERESVRADTVHADLVDLALWISAEYCSTPARALTLVLPPRGRPRTGLYAERTPPPLRAAGPTPARLDAERLTPGQRALLERLPGPAGPDLAALRRLERRGLVALGERARRR